MNSWAGRTKEFFHDYAHDFNALYGNQNTQINRVINNLFRKAMRIRYEKTLEGCQPIEGRSVIDIGCGPGHYSVALAKAGAKHVFGLDFADGMIRIAEGNALASGVEMRCRFACGDFLTFPIAEKFDYSVVMGFMDYIKEPEKVVARVLDITMFRAFFSFPASDGILAWQRKLRYRRKCELYLYTSDRIVQIFKALTDRPVTIERIDRDFFVTAYLS